MTEQLAPGDVVWLKSGSPRMVIRWIEDEYGQMTAYCDWFVETSEKGAKYLTHQLTKTKPED